MKGTFKIDGKLCPNSIKLKVLNRFSHKVSWIIHRHNHPGKHSGSFYFFHEKRIISAQAPFKELQRNYFLKSFSLQSLFPQGNCGFVGREMKKVSCAQQQQILLSIINAATLLVLTIIHVLIMFAFCRGSENETQVSVSFSDCVNKDPKK